MSLPLFEKMISLEYLFESWYVFRRGKRKKLDVQIFERHLEDNIFSIREELISCKYKHGPYFQFDVFDPKRRLISAARVRDRLVHQMVFSLLSGVFEKKFIFHSFSSRLGKGTHSGCDFLRKLLRRVSLNGSQDCYALKMDVRRFFAHIDQGILKQLLRKVIDDKKMIGITDIIIDGFQTEGATKMGLPLGNVTSQLFANIYLHELDMFIKHTLKQKCYLRFCDDFIILSPDASKLMELIPVIREFLRTFLKLELHPQKIILRSLHQGIDFLGYIHFLHHRLLRFTTKKRMLRKLSSAQDLFFQEKLPEASLNQTLQSYLGLLSHANHYNLSQDIKNIY